MKLRARLGYLFVTADTDEDRTPSGIIYGAGRRKSFTGLCHVHAVTNTWHQQGEDDLTNKRIVFDRWSGRPFKLKWSDGKEYEFISVSQWSVLAVFEDEPSTKMAIPGTTEKEGEGTLSEMREGTNNEIPNLRGVSGRRKEPLPGEEGFCGFCRGKCKGEHYISPSSYGY